MGILAVSLLLLHFIWIICQQKLPSFLGDKEAPDQASNGFCASAPLLSPLMVDGSQDNSGHPICKSTNPFTKAEHT